MRRESMVRNKSATTSTGLSRGSVTLKKICAKLALSILACSFRSRGTACSPASTIIATKGAVFQTSAAVTAAKAPKSVPSQFTGGEAGPIFGPGDTAARAAARLRAYPLGHPLRHFRAHLGADL